MNYPDQLEQIGIQLLEPFTYAKTHHKMKCMWCEHMWTATPISKLQNFKKHNRIGCPECTNTARYEQSRTTNIQKLKDRGLAIISDWNGQVGEGKDSAHIDVTVQNTVCGHIFTSTAKNLITRGVSCPTCAKQYKTNILNADSERRSNIWRQTAPEWKVYRSKVTSLTRVSYNEHKHKINPDDLPTGLAGTEGAFQLDHKVPVSYCFRNGIPPEICADHSNLQMLDWRTNVASRDHLKDNIPVIFNGYIKEIL